MDASLIFQNLQTRIISGMIAHTCDLDWGNGGRTVHKDPFARLYGVRSGEGVVAMDERMYHLRPGYLFLFPAHSSGRYRCPQSMSLTWLHFTASLFGCLDPVSAFGWPRLVRCNETTQARLDELIGEHESDDPAAVLAADGLLRQVLARFAAAAEQTPSGFSELDRLQPVLIYIEHNLHRQISLAELAGVLHLQATYFSNLFSRAMGMPPIRFINRRRAERAAALLLQSDAPISEIAAEVGFCDVYHFSKTFKRLLGLPPTHYRRQLRREA